MSSASRTLLTPICRTVPSQRLPALQAAKRYGVERQEIEGVRQSLYDSIGYDFLDFPPPQTYDLFQQGIGQPFASAQGLNFREELKTIHDTNMEIGGMLPEGKAFLVESIEMVISPSLSISAQVQISAYRIGTGASDLSPTSQFIIRTYFFLLEKGALEFIIGDKSYLEESPLHRFPPKSYVGIDSALATNSATLRCLGIMSAQAMGRPYFLDPPIFLKPKQTFKIRLRIRDTTAASLPVRIMIYLNGFLYRNAQ